MTRGDLCLWSGIYKLIAALAIMGIVFCVARIVALVNNEE